MSKGGERDFLKALFKREAGGRAGVINKFGYVGKYQFGESALIDLGYYKQDGTSANDWSGKWTGKNGINSLDDFRNSPEKQDQAAHEWIVLLCSRIKKFKLDSYIGKTLNGVKITESGMIAGAHLKGFGSTKHSGLRQYLKSGGKTDPTDGMGTPVSHYVELFSDYELDCCGKLHIGFAEKVTQSPVSGVKIKIVKNGKNYHSHITSESGLIPSLSGFSSGDVVDIFIEKIEGGYKKLHSVVWKGKEKILTFLSPRVKITATSVKHHGTAESHDKSAKPATKKADAIKKSEQSSHDKLDKCWGKMGKPQSSRTTTKKASAPVENKRNDKGNPVAVIKKEPPATRQPPVATKTIAGLLYPLTFRPKSSESYHDGMRRFGANRDHGKRKHAGVDLYAPVGTPVRAMASGTVINIYKFYLGTEAVEVDHGTFIARYGEIMPIKKMLNGERFVSSGERIERGQKIGLVGRLDGMNISMLHLEMYSTKKSPEDNPLTIEKHGAFSRRDDLMDPTSSLDKAEL